MQETEPEKDITINRGYPDFIIKDSEKMEGVDVMAIRDKRRTMSSLMRFQERYMRAYFEVNEGDLDCFRIILVGQTREVIENSVKPFFERNSDRYRNEFIQIIFGFINEDGSFEKS